MLVYYSGFGYWCRQVGPGDYELLESSNIESDYNHYGVFELIKQNETDLTYGNTAEVSYLKACTSHSDGVTPQYYNKLKDHDTVFFCITDQQRRGVSKTFTESDTVDPMKITPSVVSAAPTTQTRINDKRVAEIIKHLGMLENTAKVKNKPFNRQSLKCSKPQMLKWLQSKQGSTFKDMSEATFKKVWDEVKQYRLCPGKSADEHFFSKIQG